jgi:spermidine dehydrogenase
MGDGITRRDFIDGVACCLLAGSGIAPMRTGAFAAANYPPALTGMRGSRDVDFAAAHAVRDGKTYRLQDYPIDQEVDCAVIGAGIGGLSAAFFVHREQPQARLLILDNHDDFGGHARRNEFQVDGRFLIGYGGSESIQSPRMLWSPTALRLLSDLGVRLERFETAMDSQLYPGLGMSSAVFFAREQYGVDKLVTGDPQRTLPSDIPAQLHHGRSVADFAAACPLSDRQRQSLVALFTDGRNLLAGKNRQQKIELLSSISYEDYLKRYWGLERAVVQMYAGRTYDWFALPASLVSAAYAADNGYPGFQGVGLGTDKEKQVESQPYIYHFPDGNASIARLLVRKLIPRAASGTSMEDIVTADFDYDQLDRAESPVRLRLSSTVVQMQSSDAGVDLLYQTSGQVRRVRARNAIHAGYLSMLPYICNDLPTPQRSLASRAIRAPLVYVTVAVRNWRPWAKLGVHLVNNPTGFYSVAKLDYPVSLGQYRFARTPDEPILLHLSHIPHPLRSPTNRREALLAARRDLYVRPFRDFEAAVRDELTRIVGPGGFDAERDIAGITVNRWGHGYAYEPSPLSDPDLRDKELARSRSPIGRISLAGSDTAWSAYAHAAIDEAHRAAAEVVARAT